MIMCYTLFDNCGDHTRTRRVIRACIYDSVGVYNEPRRDLDYYVVVVVHPRPFFRPDLKSKTSHAMYALTPLDACKSPSILQPRPDSRNFRHPYIFCNLSCIQRYSNRLLNLKNSQVNAIGNIGFAQMRASSRYTNNIIWLARQDNMVRPGQSYHLTESPAWSYLLTIS